MLNQRILAQLPVKATWVDNTGKSISVEGVTENVGETGTLVNLSQLPPVGSEVKLQIMEEGKPLVKALAQVIRVERDARKPMAALSILQNIKKWKETAMTAANAWVSQKLLEYEEEWVG
jgi:hypothetical protein